MDCFNSFLTEIELMKSWTKQRFNNETHNVIDELFVWFKSETTKQISLASSSQFNFTSQCEHFGMFSAPPSQFNAFTCSTLFNKMVHQNTVPIYSQFGHHLSASNHQAQVNQFSDFGNSFTCKSTLQVENQVLSPVMSNEANGVYMENNQSNVNQQTWNDANYCETSSSRVNVNDYDWQCSECVGGEGADITNQSVVCLEDIEEWSRADQQQLLQTECEMPDNQVSGDFSFQCSQVDCGYSFNLWSDLNEHTKLVHSQHEYKCINSNCHFVSASLAEVNQHFSIVHSEVLAGQDKSTPYNCPVQECSRMLSCKQGLTNQEQTHVDTTVKSFHCKWPNCTMKSKYKRSVITHIRCVHFGLPTTKKEQDIRHIVDYRDPIDYLDVVQEAF